MSKAFASMALLTAALLCPSVVQAVPIVISGDGNLGDFTGTFEYTPTNATSGVVDISLTNTSPGANGGFITAFVFNIPASADVTGALLASSNVAFVQLLGGANFDNSVTGSPFGIFDIGASTGNGFEGGGMPSGGIPVGGSATFQFALTGTALDELTAADFLGTLSQEPGQGQGQTPEDFVVRFRGFENGGSDKVPNDGPNGQSLPEPATALLLGLGLVSLWAARLRARGK